MTSDLYKNVMHCCIAGTYESAQHSLNIYGMNNNNNSYTLLNVHHIIFQALGSNRKLLLKVTRSFSSLQYEM